jgi:subtilisin family serine protease
MRRRAPQAFGDAMSPLDLVRLTPVMERTRGRPEVAIGLIDGAVATSHPALTGENIRHLGDKAAGAASVHGTFVAGILSARRGSPAPAICPGCTLLVRPLFMQGRGELPSATPAELARAIVDCVEAGAQILNISAALVGASGRGERVIDEAIAHTARRRVITVVAAGNDGALASSALTRHPWVLPVVATDARGRVSACSNLAASIARRGLGAPGERIVSVGPGDEPLALDGTSAAAAIVTGAVALLWSERRDATAAALRAAIAGVTRRRTTITPPLLDAWSAYRTLVSPAS